MILAAPYILTPSRSILPARPAMPRWMERMMQCGSGARPRSTNGADVRGMEGTNNNDCCPTCLGKTVTSVTFVGMSACSSCLTTYNGSVDNLPSLNGTYSANSPLCAGQSNQSSPSEMSAVNEYSDSSCTSLYFTGQWYRIIRVECNSPTDYITLVRLVYPWSASIYKWDIEVFHFSDPASTYRPGDLIPNQTVCGTFYDTDNKVSHKNGYAIVSAS